MHERILLNRNGDSLHVVHGKGGPLTNGWERVFVRDLEAGDQLEGGRVVESVRDLGDGRRCVKFVPGSSKGTYELPSDLTADWGRGTLITRKERQ